MWEFVSFFSPPLGKPSEPLKFETAAVAADYKTCSEYATALCVGVVNAHSAGIGSGGFMIIYDKKKGLFTLTYGQTCIKKGKF